MNTESYRPIILLTSCLCKILEWIINKKLVYVLESTDLLIPEQQYGFRKVRSITDVLIILQNHIAEAFRKKESTTKVILDLSKSYYMNWKYAIIKKIKNWKIDGKMLCFNENFMKENAQGSVGDTLSNEAAIENEVVQEAVLSVTLFLIAMSEICDGIQEPVKIIEYADDWMIFTSHKHVRTS
jgi:hypothetical protein